MKARKLLAKILQFKLMRPGTPLRKAGKGKRLPV